MQSILEWGLTRTRQPTDSFEQMFQDQSGPIPHQHSDFISQISTDPQDSPQISQKAYNDYKNISVFLRQSKNTGHWSEKEKQSYHLFLQKYHNHFVKRVLRRTDKIFKKMADYIGSRAADQCRSHHQKWQKKCGNFMGILRQLREQKFGSFQTLLIKEQLLKEITEERGQQIELMEIME